MRWWKVGSRLLGMEGGKWEKFRVGNMGVGKVGSRGNGLRGEMLRKW